MKGILFNTLRALLLAMHAAPAVVGYHSNPGSKRAFVGNRHDEGFRVSFEGSEYFVLLNTTTDMEQFEVFLGHSRGRRSSSNTADISFTEQHFGSHSFLIVAPRLGRAGGALSTDPKAIGDFPAQISGTRNRFIVGSPDAALFPRLFRLCRAKQLSIESEQIRKRQTKLNVKRAP